ncbi:hypothetical protein INT43_008159 [Umbelopsis isabellina]|uniref:AN1-type domain-containing protein n=1 Tax=Mortierella isabellina TaxID=91625 RepID=A0A8H7PD83_MORIS|nr:hypothetical protein INT43_008159 [Umbelopsis isabellina]
MSKLQQNLLEHWKREDHKCPSLNDPNSDFRVPTCPICSNPVPVKRGEDPNLRMNQHIEGGCKEKPTSTSPPSNTCRKQGCKTKLLVPMFCSSCKNSFCVKHRLESDHDCQGRRAASASPSRTANTKRNFAKFLKDVPTRPASTPITNTKSTSSASRTGLGIQPIDREHQRHRQKLEDKVRRGAPLTESEQVALATYRSQDSGSEQKNCIIC